MTLPAGWEHVRLGEFACRTVTVNPAQTPDDIFELYSVPSFANGEPDIVRGEQVGSTKQRVQPGDVLLCKIVPHINRVWAVPPVRQYPQIASGEWIVYRGHGCDPEYLAYCLSEESFRRQFLATSSGMGGSLMRARPSSVAEIKIPIAPLEEQRRIVAKLKAFHEETRLAWQELQQALVLNGAYRKAVSAVTFSKGITSFPATSNEVADFVASSPQVKADRPQIPDGWRWTSVGIASEVTGGLTKNARREGYAIKVPYLRVANVYANELRLHEVAEIGCTESEFAKTKLRIGDILVVEGNGSLEQVGRAAIWNGELDACSHQNHLIRLRVRAEVLPKFLLFWLLSPEGRAALERVASSSSGLHTLNISKISLLQMPICSVGEQARVIEHLEAAFGEIDRLTAEALSGRRLLDRLEASTLAKAVNGELEPQDPRDKPASDLLERVRFERENAPAESKRRRPRTSTTPRAPRENAAMTKSRLDPDVKGCAYLAETLRGVSGGMTATALFRKSDLPVADFYKQLVWEIDNAHVRESGDRFEAL